ncbi:DUF2199 domain-containing protein [Vibrio sp. Isolate30]|uniref:DUF2199 domain-containing protein n=1 Tax=Vibrio sp. Isolate30 TaxID=2908536 RepID=UPI001EFCB42F|nr:DUF2199 domain-containing protein [Vibrio sp. Isolate30]MCG9630417.1 DUF2199 domain-containing protein [Vibrio sp. Isolate30]
MAAIFSFKCSSCDETHEGSPSFSFRAPDPYLEQPDEIQEAGKLGTDLCYYKDLDGYHYFARVVIEIPIIGMADPFLWGVWVSLSRESYEHYLDTYEEPDVNKNYFGWLCNYLPYYESTYAMATDVCPRVDGERPYLVIHETEHEFYSDYINGISVEKAQKIAELCMHG